jgi:phosphogluconate dehydratase
MSGASGKVPAAILLTPEAIDGGPIARLRDGDMIHLDAERGSLTVELSEAELAARAPVEVPDEGSDHGCGRELFGLFRNAVGRADTGATVFA